VWFDADLAEGIVFSNAPSAAEAIYGSLFFPWTQPVSLGLGQSVGVSLETKLVEHDYVWRWSTRVEPLEGSGSPLIHFEQSQLPGEVLSSAQLHRLAADYVPHLSEEGHLRHRTLELMDGKVSLEEIARRLAAEFPRKSTAGRYTDRTPKLPSRFREVQPRCDGLSGGDARSVPELADGKLSLPIHQFPRGTCCIESTASR
jgi:hypothetical protein